MTDKDKLNFQWAGRTLEDMAFKERQQAVQEIHDVRGRLGQFTLRFMMEAIYGDRYTKEVLGESGGDILMRDIQMETVSENGGLKTTINEKQMRGILKEAGRGRSKAEIKKSNTKAKKLMQDLSEFTPEERGTIMKFMEKMGE